MSNHLFSLIRRRLPATDKTFLQTPAGRLISYGDMLRRSAQLAQLLVEGGVRPGDRVAVQVAKSPEALLLYLACVRAGAVYLPLNTGYQPGELDYFLSDARPRLFVCDPERLAGLAPLARAAGVGWVETLDADGRGSLSAKAVPLAGSFDDVARGAEDLAAILYTSGTTGRSKGAMLTHGNLASNAQALVATWRFDHTDVLLHALPIFHTHGLFVATNVALLAGATLLFLPAFDPAAVCDVLPQATTMMGVPTFYVRLLAYPGFTRAVAAHMRLFISGSAPLSPETHRAFEARCGHVLLERYGMTETSMNTSNPYDGPRRPGTVGLPLPGVTVRITDPDTGIDCPVDTVGMIEVRGPNVFKGYWQMPEKTAAELRADGFFITGDLGRIDAQGYVQIVGRQKDLIISGGYNVYPAEVEMALDALPGVAESAVIGVPHADFGEGVVAVVVGDGRTRLDEAALRDALTDQLARYKLPKRFLFVDHLPRNKMGKVQKAALRDRYHATFAGAPV